MKLVRREPGHDDVVRIVGDGETATSVIAYPEVRSALARGGGSAGALRARRELEAVWLELVRIHVDDAVASEAGTLADRHRLRGMDALHLAAALRHAGASAPETVVFASWDRDQRAAASAEGLEVFPARI